MPHRRELAADLAPDVLVQGINAWINEHEPEWEEVLTARDIDASSKSRAGRVDDFRPVGGGNPRTYEARITINGDAGASHHFHARLDARLHRRADQEIEVVILDIN